MRWDRTRIGVSAADAAPDTAPILLLGTVEENLRNAARLGYGAIELHTREKKNWEAQRIRELESETGVKIAMLVTGRLATVGQCTLADDRPYVSRMAMDCMRRYIDMAAEIQAGLVIGWVRGSIQETGTRESYIQRLTESFCALDDYAAECHVPLNIEGINRYETNVFRTAKETVDFIRTNGLKSTYVHLDTFHMNIEEENLTEAITYAGETLGYFHISDNNRRYPGSGMIDFQSVFAALEAINYQGFITVECLPVPDHTTAARKAIQYIYACIDRNGGQGDREPPLQ